MPLYKKQLLWSTYVFKFKLYHRKRKSDLKEFENKTQFQT